MNDKFSLYQTDGLWGIIENTSNEKQTSIKSYFGSDLIIKRLNEQDQQIDRLKQQLAEKDKEVEVLRKGEYQKCCQHCEAFEELVEISKQEQKDLAIQELEKVKDFILENTMLETETAAVLTYIYQQIKELKGE